MKCAPNCKKPIVVSSLSTWYSLTNKNREQNIKILKANFLKYFAGLVLHCKQSPSNLVKIWSHSQLCKQFTKRTWWNIPLHSRSQADLRYQRTGTSKIRGGSFLPQQQKSQWYINFIEPSYEAHQLHCYNCKLDVKKIAV